MEATKSDFAISKDANMEPLASYRPYDGGEDSVYLHTMEVVRYDEMQAVQQSEDVCELFVEGPDPFYNEDLSIDSKIDINEYLTESDYSNDLVNFDIYSEQYSVLNSTENMENSDFSLPTDLHKPTNANSKPFDCKACGKSFMFRADLRTHLVTHTGEKPYKCDLCGKAYGARSNLINHKKMHTDDRAFECRFCDKRFLYSSQMIHHMRSHSGNAAFEEKLFKCEQCDESFLLSSQLKAHRKVHGKTPRKCNRGKKTEC